MAVSPVRAGDLKPLISGWWTFAPELVYGTKPELLGCLEFIFLDDKY
jgi:hypothetical protein